MSAENASAPGVLTRLTGRRPRLIGMPLAFAGGAFGSLGQAPIDQPIALVIALAFAFALSRMQVRQRACGMIGWAFGTGYFCSTLLWIIEPFQVDAARHGWMAPFALVFLSSGLALFWGAAFWAARWLSLSAWPLILTWTAAEVLRAYAFTGFPWVSPAQIAVDGPVSRLLAWSGPHGTTLCLMVLAWALSLPARPANALSLRVGQGALLIGAVLAFYMPLARPTAEVTGHWVRLIQPNAAQHLKWLPDRAEGFFRRQLSLTAALPETSEQSPSLVVWPETAIPWRLGDAEPILNTIAQTSGDAEVVLGVLRVEGDKLRNSLAVLSAAGTTRAVYDKHHLVPFGEYIPFADLAASIGLRALVAQTSGFSSGDGPVLLDFGPLGRALPLICYEAVFAHGVNATPQRPDFLLQITNDAWFGTYAGPQQHLAQARMRAIEQGLPLMRAANTGISAMIDPYGRTIAHLPLNTAGFLDVPLPRPIDASLYSKTGDLPIICFLLFTLAASALRRIRRARAERD